MEVSEFVKTCDEHIIYEVPSKSVTFIFIFWDFFLPIMVLFGPTRLFIFGKSSHLHCFSRNKYKKIPTYMTY